MLETLPEQSHPGLMVGCNQADDSGVVRLTDDTALIFTVDFFPAVVDDPRVFGMVAAANALSDVYAMGGMPLCALNIVCFPAHELAIDVLGEVLRGGAEKVNEAGAVIVGGHTIKGSELMYGLAVTGTVHPDHIYEIGNARPGDRLVLSKPLGSGIYSTALKEGALSGEGERLFYETMSGLNAAASAEMAAAGASSCTDVTGFGLIGHALEMARASRVTIRIDAASVPLLPEAREFAKRGFLTGGGMANREFAAEGVTVEGTLTTEMEMLLYDPQTSGGLLVAVPDGRVEDYLAAIRSKGSAQAAIVGEVLAAGKSPIIIQS